LEEALATANAWEKHQIAGLLPEKRRWEWLAAELEFFGR
jgi:hypothetical protein